MKAPVCSFPGKLGDLIFAVDIIREVVELYRSPVTLVTSRYCVPALPLLQREPELIADVLVDESYKPVSDKLGFQPSNMELAAMYGRQERRDVLHLGITRMPFDDETLADAIGSPYQMKSRGGPWLKRVAVNSGGDGHVVVHVPMTDNRLGQGEMQPIHDLVQQAASLGRSINFVGTIPECEAYRQAGVATMPRIQIVPLRHLGDMIPVLEGCNRFIGLASGPAIVAAAVGVPCEWVLRRGVDYRWVPRDCNVRVLRPSKIVPFRAPRRVSGGRR